MCKFDIAWVGKCNSSTIQGTDYCEKHLDLQCGVCKEQATKECPTASSLVCGFLLCDICKCPRCSNR